jgi:hypothetical protein
MGMPEFKTLIRLPISLPREEPDPEKKDFRAI